MKISKFAVALPAVAMLAVSMPTPAEARTKSIVKWGAIGLGAAALSNYATQPRYNYGYYQQPYYGGYYQQPYYSYGYQQPYYGGGYYGGYYGY